MGSRLNFVIYRFTAHPRIKNSVIDMYMLALHLNIDILLDNLSPAAYAVTLKFRLVHRGCYGLIGSL